MILTHSPDRPGGDPNPSQPADLDFPTLGRLVRAEAQDLVETAASVNDELQLLSGSTDGEWAGDSLERKDEVPRSPDEIIASINRIGAAAYRVARHVRTLVEFEALLRGAVGASALLVGAIVAYATTPSPRRAISVPDREPDSGSPAVSPEQSARRQRRRVSAQSPRLRSAHSLRVVSWATHGPQALAPRGPARPTSHREPQVSRHGHHRLHGFQAGHAGSIPVTRSLFPPRSARVFSPPAGALPPPLSVRVPDPCQIAVDVNPSGSIRDGPVGNGVLLVAWDGAAEADLVAVEIDDHELHSQYG
jgi:hypothetical protein